MIDEIECLVDENKTIYYVLKGCKEENRTEDNKTEYYNNKLIHREDGPAVEWNDGSKVWIKNGLIHREDGPAFESIEGEKKYYINDIKINEFEYRKYLIEKEHNEIKKELKSKNLKKKNKI